MTLFLLCACAIKTNAQDPPRLALFTGYSYMHGLPRSDTVSLNGWAAEITLNVTRRFGVAANVSGDYGSSSAMTFVWTPGPFTPGGSTLVRPPTMTMEQTRLGVVNHYLLLGPEFRVVQTRRATVSLTAGIGAARSTLDDPTFFFVSSSGPEPTFPRSIGLAVGGGVNAEMRIAKHIAYRIMQFRYFAANSDYGWRRSLQLATGLVATLGSAARTSGSDSHKGR